MSRGLLGVAAAFALLGPAAWYLRRTTNLVSGASVPETAAPSTASLDGPLRTTPSAASATPPSAIANQSAGPAATAPAQTASSAAGANTVRPLHAASAKPVSSARLAPSVSAQAPVAPAKPNCDPPFIVDPESGARKVKPGC
jgi:cytoskeletal protein RodZ